jgi:membrane protein DedA with SNARE-associated domain
VSGLGAAIAHGGQRAVFLSVFLQQIGVPLPAEPALVAAGSLAARGQLSIAGIAIAVLSSTLVADLAWFAIGKRYGARALRFVFRLSSSPEKYLAQTERLSSRWGPGAFVLVKFIPGLPMAGPILAGTLGTTLWVFVAYDLVAMALWAGVFIALGMVFHGDVDLALRWLDRFGGWGLLLCGIIVAGLILRRWQTFRVTSAASRLAARTTPEVGSALSP